VVVGLELKAYTLNHSSSPFLCDFFFQGRVFKKIFFYLFTSAYIVWAIYPPCSPPPSSPSTPLASRQNLFCPLLQFCWREDISNSKKDIAFLPVSDKDSYIYREIPSIASMHKCITTRIDSSLPDPFTTSQSPSHSRLCCFMVTVLVPLQWTHHFQVLGFLPFPILHLCVLPKGRIHVP
jgi:hypothetical protein